MTTAQIIRHLQKTYGKRMGLSEDQMRQIFLGATNHIAATLAAGDHVRLDNLGVLRVNSREARNMVFGKLNPNAGKIQRQVTFRDGDSLKRLMNPDWA